MSDDILKRLERFGISSISHGQTTLLTHLRGTRNILESWGCALYVCDAGLCHSIYGTESFSKALITLDGRQYVQELIGVEAERMAYLFGAHKKESFWGNLDRSENFSVEDRFSNQTVEITKTDFADLVTLTLANWLDQRPTAEPQYQFVRQEEFKRSKEYLPSKAYQQFLSAYGISE